VRGGLLRIDSPARLRGSHGTRRLAVTLAAPAPAAVTGLLRGLAGIDHVESLDGSLHLVTDDPEGVAPSVVRALVAADAAVVEVRVERVSLEQIYFDVMGVRPAASGEAT
jgi:hypothetical protein